MIFDIKAHLIDLIFKAVNKDKAFQPILTLEDRDKIVYPKD